MLSKYSDKKKGKKAKHYYVHVNEAKTRANVCITYIY